MLSVRQVSAKGYRSLRALSCPVGQLEVLVGRTPGAKVRAVIKRDGATWIEGLKLFGDYGDDED